MSIFPPGLCLVCAFSVRFAPGTYPNILESAIELIFAILFILAVTVIELNIRSLPPCSRAVHIMDLLCLSVVISDMMFQGDTEATLSIWVTALLVSRRNDGCPGKTNE